MSDDGTFWSDVAGVPDTLQNFAENPNRFIWGIVLSGILIGWQRFLGSISSAFDALEDSIRTGVFKTMVSLGNDFQAAFVGFVLSVLDAVESAALSAGLGAPIALVLGWSVTVAIMVVILSMLLSALNELGIGIPLGALPVIGRWFR